MKLYLGNRFFVSTVAFTLTLVALIALVVIPSVREIKTINAQVYDERVRLEKLYVRGQLQKTVRERYNKIKDRTNFMDEALLTEGRELEYITTVEGLATKRGISVDIGVGAYDREGGRRYSTLPFTFTLNGPWPGIADFIEDIEALPFYTNIQEMTVAVRSEDLTKPRSAATTIRADTYWLAP